MSLSALRFIMDSIMPSGLEFIDSSLSVSTCSNVGESISAVRFAVMVSSSANVPSLFFSCLFRNCGSKNVSLPP